MMGTTSELGSMVSTQRRLVDAVLEFYYTTPSSSDWIWRDENKIKILQAELSKTIKDWEVYQESGSFQRALAMQYDINLVDDAESILHKYQSIYRSASTFQRELPVWGQSKEEFKKSIEAASQKFSKHQGELDEIMDKNAELQAMINKRLEEI